MSSAAAAASDTWNDLTLLQLKTELEKRNASTQVITPKTQLVQRLLRIEAGHPLEDDMIEHSVKPADSSSPKNGTNTDDDADDEFGEFGLPSEDAAALTKTAEVEGGKGGDDLEEDFGIESGDEAELEALAVEVESPNLKRGLDSEVGSNIKRQRVEVGQWD